ncbi:Gfo/Idh/MocA family oxidoreductase [Mariniblastus sp.]|nr:Gfo/Idh/MocA family oxidoreductase [Mariniblastus sp.]
MKTIKIGIVGAGQIARDVHLPVLKAIQNVKIAWIADTNIVAAQTVGKAYGIEAVHLTGGVADLPNCDIALLAIPVHARPEYYEGFAKRSIAVFAEKPLAILAGDHQKYVELFQPHELACGYMKRFFSTTIALRQIIQSKLFGSLNKIRVSDGVRATRTGRDAAFQDRPFAKGGGVLLQVGCHGLDLACYLTGAQEYKILENAVEVDQGTDRRVESLIHLKQLFGSGECCKFEFHSSWLDKKQPGVQLEFESANVSVAGLPNAEISVQDRQSGMPYTLSQANSGATTIYQAFYLEWQNFIDCWKRERECVVSGRSSTITSKLLEDLVEACK